jgi:hypothetical protein
MLPEIVGTLFGMKDQYLAQIAVTASRINSRNSSIFWESERNADIVHTFLILLCHLSRVSEGREDTVLGEPSIDAGFHVTPQDIADFSGDLGIGRPRLAE